jgi:hypothetical protein
MFVRMVCSAFLNRVIGEHLVYRGRCMCAAAPGARELQANGKFSPMRCGVLNVTDWSCLGDQRQTRLPAYKSTTSMNTCRISTKLHPMGIRKG